MSGRSKVLTGRDRRIIAQSLRHNPTLSAFANRRDSWSERKLVSLWTVKDTQKHMGYDCERPSRGPMIGGDNKIRRVQFTKQHLSEEVDWTKAVFADELQVTLHRNTIEIWRKRGSPQKASVPSQSPRVSMWSAFSSPQGVCSQ